MPKPEADRKRGGGQQSAPPARGAAVTTHRNLALAAKRGMDVTGAAVGIVVLSLVLAWTALAALIMQGPPILFRHERPGLAGRPFTMLKFRTMRPPRRGQAWYGTDQQRITRLGRLLRSTSVDELPELWNVLRGDMSLVGPRPLLSEYLDRYTPEEQRRHDMRPGITGWAAVNGRHTLRFEDRLALDVWYVDNWSLWLDLKILRLTVRQVLPERRRCGDAGFRGNRPPGSLSDRHQGVRSRPEVTRRPLMRSSPGGSPSRTSLTIADALSGAVDRLPKGQGLGLGGARRF